MSALLEPTDKTPGGMRQGWKETFGSAKDQIHSEKTTEKCEQTITQTNEYRK